MVDRDDLRELGSDCEKAGAGLQRAHHGRRDEGVGDDERVDGCGDEGDEAACEGGFVLQVQDEDADGDILDGDECRLAIGAEGEGVADVVGEGDEEAGRLEEVRGQAQALSGAGLDELEDLGHLDDGGGGDDGDAEGFGDSEPEAVRVGGDVEVEEKGAVALGAEEGDEGIVEGRGEVGGERGEVGF